MLFLSYLVKNSMDRLDRVSVICKLAMKWHLMRIRASWLCPFNEQRTLSPHPWMTGKFSHQSVYVQTQSGWIPVFLTPSYSEHVVCIVRWSRKVFDTINDDVILAWGLVDLLHDVSENIFFTNGAADMRLIYLFVERVSSVSQSKQHLFDEHNF